MIKLWAQSRTAMDVLSRLDWSAPPVQSAKRNAHSLAETDVVARRWFSYVAQTLTFRGDERERDIDFTAVGSGVS